ncbi:hypothetical protein ACJX0J_010744, partial [Zea mays]
MINLDAQINHLRMVLLQAVSNIFWRIKTCLVFALVPVQQMIFVSILFLKQGIHLIIALYMFIFSANPQGPKVVAPTPEQITAIKAAIANAHTLEEAARLEQVLSTGQVPAEFAVPRPDANMAEASDGAEKMDTDGENQEGGEADGQKQGEGSTPIQE